VLLVLFVVKLIDLPTLEVEGTRQGVEKTFYEFINFEL
jgi:hypothetical protein